MAESKMDIKREAQSRWIGQRCRCRKQGSADCAALPPPFQHPPTLSTLARMSDVRLYSIISLWFVAFILPYLLLFTRIVTTDQSTMVASYHSHAPWRKAILIPFWTLQLGFEILMIGLVAVAAGYLSHYGDESSYSVVDENGTVYEVDDHALNLAEHRYEVPSKQASGY